MSPLTPDLGHVGSITAHRLATFAADVRHVLAILADRRSPFPSDFCHVSAVTADRLAPFAADSGHVAAILAYPLSSLSSRFSGLIGRKLVCPTLDVGCFAPLACYLALPLVIHRGESAPRPFRHDDALLIAFFDTKQMRCLFEWLCAGFPRVK
jgi:hypothetical protein